MPFVFVRLQGCNLRCHYCDTSWSWEEKPTCRIQTDHGFQEVQNPVSVEHLTNYLSRYPESHLTFTGGEPLLQAPFIENVLRQTTHKILIETNGTVDNIPSFLINRVDFWSVDLKLPSLSGETLWNVHRNFLRQLAHSKQIFLKVVFAPNSPLEEIYQALEIAKECAQKHPSLILVFQPLSNGKEINTGANFKTIMQIAEKSELDIRIIPQIHKILNME